MANEYDYETTLTFRKTNKFWNFLNKQMIINDRDTLNDELYHFIFFSTLPSNFNNILDQYGCIDTNASNMEIISDDLYTDVEFHLGVEWLNNGESGFNIFLDEWNDNTDPTSGLKDVNIEIEEDEEFYVKGVALCKTSGSQTGTDYVVAYARSSTPIRCFNYITFMKGTSFVGHNSCEEI